MSTQLDISGLISADEFCPFDMSNNAATLGDNAGELTWGASKECAESIRLLDTDEKRDDFRAFVKSSGGWTEEEITAWDNLELNALCLQWIAGDIREAFGDAEPQEWDWEDYREQSEAGQVSSRLFRDDNGKIYFDISE